MMNLQTLMDNPYSPYASILRQYRAKAEYFACACLQKNGGYNVERTPGKWLCNILLIKYLSPNYFTARQFNGLGCLELHQEDCSTSMIGTTCSMSPQLHSSSPFTLLIYPPQMPRWLAQMVNFSPMSSSTSPSFR